MSHLVTGYIDGHPQYSDNVPSRGRVSGIGGSALGHVLAAPAKPRKLRVRLPRQQLSRVHVQCGFVMPRGSVCVRDPHRTGRHRRAAVG